MSDVIIRIWQFERAPHELRALASELPNARWVIQIPISLYGEDLDEAIRLRAGVGPLQKVETLQGDIVYFGASELAPVMATVLAANDRPSAPQP